MWSSTVDFHGVLRALSASVSERISAVSVNAAAALVEVDSLRDAVLARLRVGAEEIEASMQIVDQRCTMLRSDISRAESVKIAALETELVVVDGFLARIDTADTDNTDLRSELYAHFGDLPLEPIEPATLRLEPSPATSLESVLIAPRGLLASDVSISGPPPAPWVSAGGHFRFVVAVRAPLAGPEAQSEQRAADALVSRLRVSASLVPTAGSLGPALALPATCQLAPDACAAVVIDVALPSELPPGGEGTWALRLERVALGGSLLDLAPLARATFPFFSRPQAGPVCPAGTLFDACLGGRMSDVRSILDGPRGAFSTEETDRVREIGLQAKRMSATFFAPLRCRRAERACLSQ